jgi:hypothetical protein
MVLSVVFFMCLILYSIASIVISRKDDDVVNVWLSFGLLLYSVVCFYVVVHNSFKFNFTSVLNALAFLINFGLSVSTVGMLFNDWHFHYVFSFQLILCSLWVFVYRFHIALSPNLVDIVFVESNRKRITFFEVE